MTQETTRTPSRSDPARRSFTVREQLRQKHGDERALVRAMYDIASEPKKRRRRKGKS